MNLSRYGAELQRCHQVFDLRHAELRSDLLRRLPREPRPVRVPRRRQAPFASRRLLRGIALAACAVAAAAIWLCLPLGVAKPVYGLEELPARLQTLRSISVRGTSYHKAKFEPDKKNGTSPLAFYVGRPNHCWSSQGELCEVKVGELQRGRVQKATDGKRYIVVNDAARTVTEGKEIPLAAEYTVESYIQGGLVQQLLGDPTGSGYKKLRSEQLDGRTVDVYERVFEYPDGNHTMRYVVWLNPATGLPVKIQQFGRFQVMPEELWSSYDDIEVDVEPPPGAFDFAVPEGYAVTHADRDPDAVGSEMSGGYGSGDKWAFWATRFAFNIDERAVLLCWVQFDDFNEEQRESGLDEPIVPPASALGDCTYTTHFLRVDPGKRFHWRWALVLPKEQPTLGRGNLVFTLKSESGGGGTLFTTPLQLDRERLGRWVIDSQRLTLPKDAPPDAALTLEQIEGLIDKLSKAAGK